MGGGGVLVTVIQSWWWWALVVEPGALLVVHVGACGRWWRHHAKGVEQGAPSLSCVWVLINSGGVLVAVC